MVGNSVLRGAVADSSRVHYNWVVGGGLTGSYVRKEVLLGV